MANVLSRAVNVEADGLRLPGDLAIPEPAIGVVVFAHGSGSSRRSPRNARVAERLHAEGLGNLLFDLLTDDEAGDRDRVFDIELLARRLEGTVGWLRRQPDAGHLPMAFFGASTGAAAALVAAARLGSDVASVVSRGGRPDLAGDALEAVTAPTLLIVGGADPQVLELNRRAQGHLRGETRLEIVDHDVSEGLHVRRRIRVALRRDRLPVVDRDDRSPRTPEVQTRFGPSFVRPPDADGDHGCLRCQGDPSRTLATTHQPALRLRVDHSLREDAGQRAAPDRLDRDVEGALVALTAAQRDLPVQAQGPAEPELAEELRRDQEPGHAPATRARGQGQHDAVERGDVVTGHDRGARGRDPVGTLDAEPEQDPPEEPDHRDAEQPPPVQVAASSHPRMLLARGPGLRGRVLAHRSGSEGESGWHRVAEPAE